MGTCVNQIIPIERQLTPRERKEWTAGVVRCVSGNALTTAIVLMLESCEIKNNEPIELSSIRLDSFDLTHREIVAGCKKLQALGFIFVERVRPGYWRARLRMPGWKHCPYSSLD
jgi:hypothetical protein